MRWIRLRHDERGVALITTLLLAFAFMILVASLTAYAVGSMPISRRDQDWNAALASAEAGIDDYIYRMNDDAVYWTYSATTPPPDGNKAFTQYVTVPGQLSDGTFTYTPDASTMAADRTVKLTVTGKVRKATRTLYATIRRGTFLDYLYFTDYETSDPATYVKPPDPFTPAEAQTNCAKHYYEGRNSSCKIINFITADVLNGPMHSNDAINISGNPQFLGDASTSWNDPAGKRWRGSGSPSFVNPGDPKFMAPLTLPPSNSSLRADSDGTQGGKGCLYTGPTQITVKSNGKMDIVSPFSKSYNAGCAPGTDRSLPVNGVIYVQNVPSGSTDPNYTNGCPYAGNYPAGLPVPIATDLNVYNCRDGDVFISGTLSGRLTIAADHNVVVVDNTTYLGGAGGSDILGLIANNYVEVFHPVSCTTTSSSCNLNRKSGTKFTSPTIQAAILSVQHSFRVQYYGAGNPIGTLNILGAIAQRYRGAVGTSSGGTIISGYLKGYVYDTRLRWQSPPNFLDPVKSAWRQVTWAEI